MPALAPAPCASPPVWRWRLLAGLLICATAGSRIIYFGCNCPLDLAPDEAHYWDWSRHLDWSYYSKGPLVAYLIRAGCLAAGEWSQQLMASDMLAVRLPAIICGALMLVSLYVLTAQVLGRESWAFGLVALMSTSPVVAAGSSLMTIDAPYTCCWGWALVLGYQAFERRSAWAYPLLGLVIGLGILAKYTMVLWIPSAALFLFLTPAYRPLLFRRGFWIMTAIAAVCCLPILLWNLEHDWVSWRHVGGQAGIRESAGIRWLGPFVYVGMQCALLLGFWFVAWAAAMITYRPWRETTAGLRYLWWMSAPMFLVFLVFSLKTPEEPNWPVTAYLSGAVLTVPWFVEQMQSSQRWRRWATVSWVSTACGLGLAASALMYRSDWFQPVLLRMVGPPTAQRPLPLRRFDPTCRLRGWRYVAGQVDLLREQLEAEGTQPLLGAFSWTIPGELGFYCRGNPFVYSLGLAVGDRHSQYDLWRPNPIEDGSQFLGRTFILVGDLHPTVAEAFEKVEKQQTIVYRERGQPIALWTVTVCRGFRGFKDAGRWIAERAY
jgi:hypothetical protein